MKKSLLIVSLLASLSSISQISYANQNNLPPAFTSSGYNLEIKDTTCNYDKTFPLTQINNQGCDYNGGMPYCTATAYDSTGGFQDYLNTCVNASNINLHSAGNISMQTNQSLDANYNPVSQSIAISLSLSQTNPNSFAQFELNDTPSLPSQNGALSEVDNIPFLSISNFSAPYFDNTTLNLIPTGS